MRAAFVTPIADWTRATEPDAEEPTRKQPEHLRLLALSLTDELEASEVEPESGIRRSAAVVDTPPTSAVVPVATPTDDLAFAATEVRVEIAEPAAITKAPAPSALGRMIASAIVAAAVTVMVLAAIVGLPRPNLVRITRSMAVLDVHRAVTTRPTIARAKKRPAVMPAVASFPKRPVWKAPKKPARPVVPPRGGIVRTAPF